MRDSGVVMSDANAAREAVDAGSEASDAEFVSPPCVRPLYEYIVGREPREWDPFSAGGACAPVSAGSGNSPSRSAPCAQRGGARRHTNPAARAHTNKK